MTQKGNLDVFTFQQEVEVWGKAVLGMWEAISNDKLQMGCVFHRLEGHGFYQDANLVFVYIS